MGSGLFFCWIPPRLYDRGQLRPPRVAPMEPKPPQEPINIGQVQLWQDGICQPFQTQPEYLEEKRPVGEEHGEKSPVGCFKHLLCGWNVLVLYHHPRIRRSSLQQTQKQNNLTEASSCLLLAHHKPSNLQHMFLFLKTNGVEKNKSGSEAFPSRVAHITHDPFVSFNWVPGRLTTLPLVWNILTMWCLHSREDPKQHRKVDGRASCVTWM